MNCFESESVEIATLIRKADEGEDIFNPNQPKVIINTEGDAIYFSRAAIPYLQRCGNKQMVRETYIL